MNGYGLSYKLMVVWLQRLKIVTRIEVTAPGPNAVDEDIEIILGVLKNMKSIIEQMLQQK